MSDRGAIAIFVKTIGRSPVKTRLAAAIGRESSTTFYRLCLAATEAVVRKACARSSLDAYWAVAEAVGVDDDRWRSFATLAQGEGDLGERLDRVYRELLARHSFVLLIGADVPLLSAEAIQSAARLMRDADRPPFVISRSHDGGYGLFAGRVAIPGWLWCRVPYSSPLTADEFVSQLRGLGDVAELPAIGDVDVADDLARLLADAAGSDSLLAEQTAVVDFAAALLEGRPE